MLHSPIVCGTRLVLCILVLLPLGCAAKPRPTPPQAAVFGELQGHCAPTAPIPTKRHLPAEQPAESFKRHSGDVHATSTTRRAPSALSSRARQMAMIVGLDPLIAQIPVVQDELAANVDGADMRLLTLRRQLSDRLFLALIDAGSIVAELDCERTRAEELAVRLEEMQNDIQHRRTIRAIVGEASLQMTAGVLLALGAPAIAGGAQIAGNINALINGLAALGGAQQTDMAQPRNLLGELWDAPQDPVYFPDTVWRFLNQPAKEADTATRRDAILSIWRGRLGAPDSEEQIRLLELYFGKGGVYGVEELRHRADMLSLLKAFVNLMHQDLNLLFRETLTLLASTEAF